MSPPVVVAIGFDLFFRPKLQAAARDAGVELRTPATPDAVAAAAEADRLVADASAPGVEDVLGDVKRARPELPILVCYPHVESDRAARMEALGIHAVTRGAFNQRLEDALRGGL